MNCITIHIQLAMIYMKCWFQQFDFIIVIKLLFNPSILNSIIRVYCWNFTSCTEFISIHFLKWFSLMNYKVYIYLKDGKEMVFVIKSTFDKKWGKNKVREINLYDNLIKISLSVRILLSFSVMTSILAL